MTRNRAIESLSWEQGGPVAFIGQPGTLRGEVRVTNLGSARAVLRDVRIWISRDEDGEAQATPVRIRPASIRANETRTIPITLEISPQTHAGEYRGQLGIGDARREIVVSVLENLSLSVTPGAMLIPNRPGDTVTTRIFLSNTGNVPLTVDEIGAVQLEDELLECRIARRAFDNFDSAGQTYQDFLTELVQQAKATISEIGPLVVRNKSGVATLQPGGIAPLDLDIRLPKNIDHRGSYTGIAMLYNAQLALRVVPGERRGTASRQTT